MIDHLRQKIEDFLDIYLTSPAGKVHYETASENEPREVRSIFSVIQDKYLNGEDATDDVLRRLLPHFESEFHRKEGYRVSTWPCIRKDVRGWFENAGWKTPDDWKPTARMLFDAIAGAVSGNWDAWQRFLESDFRRGFGTGFVSPILFCLDDEFPIINSKVVKLYRYATIALGKPDQIDASLDNYRENAEKVVNLQEELSPEGLDTLLKLDLFCHYHAISTPKAKRTSIAEANYDAWMFVANPKIFEWNTAFEQRGVSWTGSVGHYPQKLIREQIKKGDRVFGYETGPTYAIICELEVSSAPYQTPKNTWAVDLRPIQMLDEPITLSTLKEHRILSQIKFVQQTQISISGITLEQLDILDDIIKAPVESLTEFSEVDQICADLEMAQYDTQNPQRFEVAIKDAFQFLGFDADHEGGPGKTDVLLEGHLGSETYKVVVDAKTAKKGESLGKNRVDFDTINQHRDDNTAEYALIVAPNFSGGNIQEFAEKHGVALLDTPTLVKLLNLHAAFPFGVEDLRQIFDRSVHSNAIAESLERVHNQRMVYLELVNVAIKFFDEHQRQNETIERIDSNSLYWFFKNSQIFQPDRNEIEQVLIFLSSPILGILRFDAGSYILTVSPNAARTRLDSLTRMLGEES